MQQPLPFSKSPRIDVVDALRGFALMVIFLIHCISHFAFFPANSNSDISYYYPDWFNMLDKVVNSILFFLFSGKAYAIFAMLFGFTFHLQYANQQKKGEKDFGPRFLWRLSILAVFAVIKSVFFPAGDILLLYAILGVFLFIVRKWSDKAVFMVAIFFLLQPTNWILSIVNPHTISGVTTEGVTSGIMGIDFPEYIRRNITDIKMAFNWWIESGRFSQSAGLFMVGLLIGRKQLFVTSEANIRFWNKILVIFLVLLVFLRLLKIGAGAVNPIPLFQQTVFDVLHLWQNFILTIIWVALFYLLYQKETFRKWTSDLRVYGKMGLTNYVFQSVLAAFIYVPIVWYSLTPYCSVITDLIIGFMLFLLQVQLSKWWLEKHKQGPLESLWHKLTWLRSDRELTVRVDSVIIKNSRES